MIVATNVLNRIFATEKRKKNGYGVKGIRENEMEIVK